MDLEYPEVLHNSHNEYPLAPESIQIPDDWYSPYQKALAEEQGISKDKTKKPVLTLRDEKNYVLHYRNLQLCLSLGLNLKKVHRVLSFDQEAWMEPYIRLNTELRKRATSDFEKNFFKLMNNSVFGKTMENVRNRVTVNLVRSYEIDKLRKLTSNPLFARSAQFAYDLVGIKMHNDKVILNKPAYTGMCSLDL